MEIKPSPVVNCQATHHIARIPNPHRKKKVPTEGVLRIPRYKWGPASHGKMVAGWKKVGVGVHLGFHLTKWQNRLLLKSPAMKTGKSGSQPPPGSTAIP